MPELKFTGPATLKGFPSDKPFAFELEANRLVVRAGKDVFAIIEREVVATVVNFPNGNALGTPITPTTTVETDPNKVQYHGYDALTVPSDKVLQPTEYTLKEQAPGHIETDTGEAIPTGGKGKVYKGSPEAVILIDTSRKVAYRTIRAKYFDTLKTAQGRTVGWWANTSMVKALEGDPLKMLQFFVDDGSVRLNTPSEQNLTEAPDMARMPATLGGKVHQAGQFVPAVEPVQWPPTQPQNMGQMQVPTQNEASTPAWPKGIDFSKFA